MTLTRLLLAWLMVAVWFVVMSSGIPLLVVASLPRPGGEPAAPVAVPRLPRLPLTWRLVEAVLLTLIASLWFDSLGSGSWWLLFLLIGALATLPPWLRSGPEALPRQALVVGACADVARYVVAGAILAWRLG